MDKGLAFYCLTVIASLYILSGTNGLVFLTDLACLKPIQSWLTKAAYLELEWGLPAVLLQDYETDSLQALVHWFSMFSLSHGNCTETTLRTCRWIRGSPPYLNFDTVITVNVTLVTKVTNVTVAQGIWTVDPLNCSQPPQLDVVEVKRVGSDCLAVSWRYNGFVDKSKKAFIIQYQGQWDTRYKEIDAGPSSSQVICDLVPYTVYNISVQCALLRRGQPVGYRSDVTMATERTAESVPAVSPAVTLGGFVARQKRCKTNTERTVTVYWQQLQEKDRNGIITGYQLEVQSGSTRQAQTVVMTTSLATSTDLVVPCQSLTTVAIRARTEVGLSVTPSHLHIPDSHSVLSARIQVLPEVVQGPRPGVTVRWMAEAATGIVGYTVYWCREAGPGKCEEQMHWNQTTLVSMVMDPATAMDMLREPYIVGVSMETETSSSGITWTDCLYSALADLRPPANVHVVADQGPDRSLTIAWDRVSCHDRKPRPFIIKFIVYVCESSPHAKPCSETEVDGSLSSVVIDDGLDPSMQYEVSMVSVGQDGNRSAASVPLLARPYMKGTGSSISPHLLALVVLGIIAFAAIVAGATLGIYRRVCRRKPLEIGYPDVIRTWTKHSAGEETQGLQSEEADGS